jgi:hypothetical protein
MIDIFTFVSYLFLFDEGISGLNFGLKMPPISLLLSDKTAVFARSLILAVGVESDEHYIRVVIASGARQSRLCCWIVALRSQ